MDDNTTPLNKPLLLLYSIFVVLLVITNLMGGKITTVAGISFSVGLFAFPFTFLITDIIAEVYGKSTATQVVRFGFVALVVALLFVALYVALPFAERSLVAATEYNKVFGAGLRITLASLISFIIAQSYDVSAFMMWKKITSGKFLWIRNNASTIVSQAIDTMLFYIIGLLYIPFFPPLISSAPHFTFGFIIQLAVPYFVLKVAMALFDTPLVYLGVRWLKKTRRDIG